MTTGRINQVTIVRRGWPTGAARAPERCQVTGGACVRRAAHSAPGRWPGARWRQSAFPLFVPRASLRRRTAVAVAWAPQEEDSAAASTIRRPRAGFPPLLSDGARQRPVAHRTHPAPGAGGACDSKATPVRREPERPVSGGATRIVIQSLAKPGPASLYKRARFESQRYGTVGEVMQGQSVDGPAGAV